MATPKKSFPKGCLLAFFAIFVLAGIGVVIAGLYDLYEKRIRAKRMKPVEVTILSSEVSVSTSSDSTSYYFDVEFEYELDGKKFVADKYALGVRSSLKRRECNRLIKKYKVGETYTGYYDPESPDYAVLNIDPDNTYLFFILFGAAFIVVPIIAYRSITTARARAEERRRELIENRISRPSTNANPWLLCAVGLVVGGGGVLFLGVGGDEIQGAPRYFVMGFIGIGFLVFLGGLMAFPRHRMMNATSMAFEHAPYAPGEQVRFILFDPSGAVAADPNSSSLCGTERPSVGAVIRSSKNFRTSRGSRGRCRERTRLSALPKSPPRWRYRPKLSQMKVFIRKWVYC
ncbi:MAG: DUF3592 domain-containing protein [Planctomycetota bacterium]|nr:DUF3592 domain-containing protein [Planctomycetota bacterium]